MCIFLVVVIVSAQFIKYSWDKFKETNRDDLVDRCREPNSYLNNLIQCEYFNKMGQYYKTPP
jgi:hypothetical protein